MLDTLQRCEHLFTRTGTTALVLPDRARALPQPSFFMPPSPRIQSDCGTIYHTTVYRAPIFRPAQRLLNRKLERVHFEGRYHILALARLDALTAC